VRNVPRAHPLRAWFAGLVEDRFHTELGVADPSLVDYLTDLLTEFIHVERINVLADGSGRLVGDVADELYQIGSGLGNEERLREMHRHIGDYTLFWTGVYPENLRRTHRRPDRETLLLYFDQGKRSYSIASRLSDDQTHPPARLLRTLSDEFESCAYGLRLVRQEWEREGPAASGQIDVVT